MRLAFAASAFCVIAQGLSLTQAAQPAPAAATTAAATLSPAPAAGDAAAKHLQRTACLKESKTRKLIGAQRSAFLKSCIEGPQQPISASRQIPPNRP